MAQVLKKEKEDVILKTSRSLFLTKGYLESSMKDIAKKANISVGNLYHYHKNKTDIAFKLVKPLFDEIDVFIKKYTNNDITLFSKKFNFTKKDIIKPKQISLIISNLINHLVDLYEKYEDEYRIVNSCNEIVKYLKDWLSSLILYFIEKKYKILNVFNDEMEALIPSYTNAIIEGAINIFTDKKLSLNKKKKVLQLYFRSYLSMLDIKNITVKG